MQQCDFLIVGGGIAGLSAALEASKYGRVILLTKGKIGQTATEKAQGGIAAAIDKIKDSTDLHYQDTIKAGAGLCDEAAVKILVTEGVERVKELIALGARFDRAETEGGHFALALEGAHKRRRILHAGDATGEEIQKTLGRKIVADNKVEIHQRTIGLDLLVENNHCYGIKALNLESGKGEIFSAKTTIIATGGIGQVYLYTTNPEDATGDGIAMAYRAGAKVQDMEFVQFHPTSLVQSAELKDIIALPRFLISEAVRGEGAMLINTKNERFMQKYDTQAELAPRDIVARAIFAEMEQSGVDHVFLSLVQLGAEKIKKRFPVIYKTCLERGLDITKDKIPVGPAAHYFMGGIKTNINGQTSIKGLFAAGECASLRVHGANRLASNSLLDGLVFGHRAAIAAKAANNKLQATCLAGRQASYKQITNNNIQKLNKTQIQRFKLIIKSQMWKNVGIIRSKQSLQAGLKMINEVNNKVDFESINKEEVELKNLATVAKLITQAALERKKSLGAHFRLKIRNI